MIAIPLWAMLLLAWFLCPLAIFALAIIRCALSGNYRDLLYVTILGIATVILSPFLVAWLAWTFLRLLMDEHFRCGRQPGECIQPEGSGGIHEGDSGHPQCAVSRSRFQNRRRDRAFCTEF